MSTRLTPSQRAFLEAVQRGGATQLRYSNPYRTVVDGSDRAVPRAVLAAVRNLVEMDFDGGTTWEKPYRLTEAGVQALTEN